jgi:hypothetical protein
VGRCEAVMRCSLRCGLSGAPAGEAAGRFTSCLSVMEIWLEEHDKFHNRATLQWAPGCPKQKGLFHPTSSGRRRARRACLVGRPRSPFAEGVENKLPQGVPRRGLVVRPSVAWSLPLLPSLDLVCIRALPAGEPAEGRAFHARWPKPPSSSGPDAFNSEIGWPASLSF